MAMKAENNRQTSYRYDGMGRLIEEIAHYRGTEMSMYTYDLFGNRTRKHVNQAEEVLSITDYKYDLNNRLIQEIDGNVKDTYSYDKNGNMVFKARSKANTPDVVQIPSIGMYLNGQNNQNEYYAMSFGYDKLNMLTNVTGKGVKASYGYDAAGRRVSKTVNGRQDVYAWDGMNIVAETNPESGNVSSFYLRGANGLISMKNGGNEGYYFKNAHGDVDGMMVSGTLYRYNYDAFGNQKQGTLQNNIADSNPFRYRGEFADAETGMIYLRARYYDPAIGRFASEDPIKDGLNWYSYCHNDPVMVFYRTTLFL